jgi:hypothetical protein
LDVGQDAKVIPLRSWKKNFDSKDSRRFLEDLRDNAFVTILAYEDGRVTVFAKGLNPENLELIREAFNDAYPPERTADADTHT